MMEWYVVREGKPLGPYSDFQFHRLAEVGAVTPTDLVWYTGRKELIPAGRVRNLFAATPSPTDQCLPLTAPPSRSLPDWLVDYIPSVEPKSGDSHAPCVRKISYLRRHWRGDLSLGFTFWVNGTLFFIALCTLPIIAPVLIASPDNPVRTWISLLGFLAALAIVSVWQIVGIWRSAGKHRSRGGKSAWGWAARIMVVLFVLNNVNGAVKYVPTIIDGSMALLGYDPLGTYRIRLLRDGTELEVSGTITFGITKDVLRALDSSQIIIHLNSVGGRMAEGHELQKLIRARSLITYTASECSSACAIAFLGGQRRLIAAQARLGFHQPRGFSLSQTDLQAWYAAETQRLIAAGVDPGFAYRALSVSNADMWYPTVQELFEAGVITGVSSRPDSDSGEAAGEGVPEAQCNLDWMYAHGQAVMRDDVGAVKWYRKAAVQGFSHAQRSLAVMYYEGRGVKPNYAEALNWYRNAGDQGDAMAQFDVGLMYERGDGVTRDDSEAVNWYRKAASQGYDRAQHRLGLMYYWGKGVTKDYTEACAWLSLAAAQGNDEAKAKQMTSQKITMAQKNAAAWKAVSAQQWLSGNKKGRYANAEEFDRKEYRSQ